MATDCFLSVQLVDSETIPMAKPSKPANPSKVSEEIFFSHPEFQVGDWMDYIERIEGNDPELASELREFIHEMQITDIGEVDQGELDESSGFGSDVEVLDHLRRTVGVDALPGAPPTDQYKDGSVAPNDPSDASPHSDAGAIRLMGRTGNFYLLLRRIGIGGHGTVYLARQAEPFDRHLAVKIYHTELQELARRESPTPLASLPEILALNRLKHPGIGQIFDAGLTPWNHPFVVMEYIEGLPITRYASTENLDLERRIRLFQELAEILQHAHDQGINHLDLKPTNTVVQAGVRKVRVIDFSIARLGSKSANGSTTQVATTQGPACSPQEHDLMAPSHDCMTHGRGTIGYRSPEQAGILEAGVDHRTDIFACGCVLVELLCDEKALPVEKATPQTTETKDFYELRQRQIAEALVETPRPCMATVSNKSRAELSRIVQRCLAFQPRDRYESLNDLNQDLTQWLMANVSGSHSLPSRKPFVLSIVAVLIAVAALAWGVILHRSSPNRLEASRSQESVSTSGLAAELTNEFTRRWNMPSMRTPIARKEKHQLQLIDALVAQLDELETQKRADVLEKMLDQTFFAGEFAFCGGIAEAALARLQASPATRNLRATAANYLLTTDVSGDGLRKHLETAIGILDELKDQGNGPTAHGNLLLARVSHVLLTSGRDEDRELALHQLQSVLDNSDGFLRQANPHSLVVMNTMIAWHLAQRRPADAMRLVDLVGANPDVLAQAAQDAPLRFAILRATALQQAKQIDEAHRCLDEAIERTKGLPPTWYGALFVKKAELFEMQGNLESAHTLLSEHQTLASPNRGIDAHWVFLGNMQLGRVLVKQKKFSEAIPILARAIELCDQWREVVPTDAPVFTHIWCAEAHSGAGDTQAAIDQFRAALLEFNLLRDQGRSQGVIADSIGKRIEEKIAALQQEWELFKAE